MRILWAIVFVISAGVALMLSTNWIRGLLGGTSTAPTEEGGGGIWETVVDAFTGGETEEEGEEEYGDSGSWVASVVTYPFDLARGYYDYLFGDEA